MTSGIRFMACSGAMGNTQATLYSNGQATTRLEIFGLEPGATDNPNRLGLFGSAGAPNSAVVVGQYQDRTHVTNHGGSNLGHLVNVKYTGATSASVSGVAISVTGHTLATIPQASGTLLARFTEPTATAVIVQNATLSAVDLTAASGLPDPSNLADGITVQAAQLQDTAGNAGDSSWTTISSAGAALSLADQSMLAVVHDYHLIISGSPSSAGRKIDWGFYMSLEYL
jgi:hypothetical protein